MLNKLSRIGGAAVIGLGLALQDLSAAPHIGHASFLGIPAHHSKASVRFQNGAQHHPVARLKDVQGQHFLREQHHVGQREQWQLAHSQLRHVAWSSGKSES